MPHPLLPKVRVRVKVGVRFTCTFKFMGQVGGYFWEVPHPPLPKVRVRVRVKVGVRFIFKFMGGVGGWFLGNVPPTRP